MKKTIASFAILFAACSAESGPEVRIDQLPVGEAPNSCGTDYHRYMASLAAASALELGRWQSTRDFNISERGRLELSDEAKATCTDGCPQIEALLRLQDPEAAALGHDPELLRQHMRTDWQEQADVDAASGEIPHQLTFQTRGEASCGTMFWFHATEPACEADCDLERTAELSSKLVFAGYPENPYLDFQAEWTGEDATGERNSWVGIDPTGFLNDGGGESGGGCADQCVAMDVRREGECCICDGEYGTFRFGSNSLFLRCLPS